MIWPEEVITVGIHKTAAEMQIWENYEYSQDVI